MPVIILSKMSVWFSYPEEEVYRELTAKLQQYQGETDTVSAC